MKGSHACKAGFIPIRPFLPITPLTYHKHFLLQAPCTDRAIGLL